MHSFRKIVVFVTFLQVTNCAPDSNDPDALLETNSNIPAVSEDIKKTDLQKSSFNPSIGNVTDDELEQRNNPEWKYKKVIKGYEIMSNEIKFKTRILQNKKIVKIEMVTGSARTVELITSRRDVEIKISTWNKISKVRIRVPFGYQPEELKILEKPTKIAVFAPFDFIEFQAVTTAPNSTQLPI